MPGWDALFVGARWPKCGHPRTLENTLRNRGQYVRCRCCQNQRSQEWHERAHEDSSREALKDF